MKRLFSLVTILLLAVTLSGCAALEQDMTDYYTQDEVDELLVEQKEYIDEEFIDLGEDLRNLFDSLEAEVVLTLEEQEYNKERLYEIVSVTIIEVNEGVYLTETSGFTTDQYVVVTEKTFVLGDVTNVAVYLNGDVRMWNELKEFD